MAKTVSKSFSRSNSSQKLPHFTVLTYSLYGQPRYFKFKQKYKQIQPMFPDYLSVSYDYGDKNLDKYFPFYSNAGSKVQNKGNIYKNLNNCMP